MFVLWIFASVVYRGFAESAVAADPIPNLLSKKLNESLVEAQKSAAGNSSCPDGWLFSPEFFSCYFKIDNMDFAVAQLECKKYGANLASIHSEAENQFVFEYAKQNVTIDDVDENVVMIGAQRVAGNWTWLDETPFDYALWAPGEPNNWQYPGNEDEALVRHEDCVTIYFSREFGSDSVERVGKWNDNVCNEPSLVSICKKPAEK